MRSPKKPILFAVLGGLVLIAVAAVILLRHDRASPRAQPKRGPIVEAIYGIGTVTARKHFGFKLGVSSTVLKTFVHEGEHVKQGQPLIRLESNLTIRTPFDGTVTSFLPNEGENIFPDQVIVTVEDLKDRYVLATIEQQSALRVREGLDVEMHFEALRNQVFSGKVDALYPSKGQFMVRIEAPELPESILPGMTADVSIEVARRENALLVPVLAIQRGKTTIERDGKKMKVDLEVGASDSEWAEITGGDLKETDLVLLKE